MFYATIFLFEVNIICILVPATSSFGIRSDLCQLLITCQRRTQGKDCHEPIVEEPFNMSHTESNDAK